MSRYNRTTPPRITKLEENQIFVFGSNEIGVHGAGAAAMALKFGAIYGNPIGLQGNTYAIPTKDHSIYCTLPLPKIGMYVDNFIDFAIVNTDKIFLVTEIGCGLAGLTPNQIAPLFTRAMDKDNIHLPARFWDILKSPRKDLDS